MRPDWLGETTHKDWLMNGHRINSDVQNREWEALEWDKAWMDMGPSPAGNLGPYWHVPVGGEFADDEMIYRLYPKLPNKWHPIIRQAIEEVKEKSIR